MSITATMVRQFEKEREFAKLIMEAPTSRRTQAYAYAYEELYRLFPDLQTDEDEESNRVVTSMSFIWPFIARSKVVVEIGAGRCKLAQALAQVVKKVVALDVAVLADTARFPINLTHEVFNGRDLPMETNSVDTVISDNVVEHLHPEDGLRQSAEALRVLKPGGSLVLLTPNYANGPHDISTFFSRVPAGLHLKEYSCLEIRAMLKQAGFAKVRAYVGAKGYYMPLPCAVGAVLEQIGQRLPRSFTRRTVVRWLLPNRFTAAKPA